MAAFSGNNALPEGWLLCNGTAVSRETYAALYSAIGDTYGAGDESTTFNLPNLTDKFIQGNAVAGTEHSAGLPNIEGIISNTTWLFAGMDASGSFYAETHAAYAQQSGTLTGTKIYFDASRSSAVYGASNTVQPPSVTMKYIIYSGVASKKSSLRPI